MTDPQDNSNPYLSDPDVKLMLEFQAGDKSSFEKLMVGYYSRVLNFIYRYVGSRENAEDLTQEVFIKVYKNAGRYRPESKFQTWVFTIAKNVSLNELRKTKRSTVSLDETIASEEGEMKKQIADTKASMPDDDMVQKERAEVIRSAINDLPENQRTAVLLRRYENLSYEEIAGVMNTSIKAVKSLLSRAKENLRQKLSGLLEKG